MAFVSGVSVSRLACIIPVVGSVEGLETTLVSVLERKPDDCEVVVVLDTPYQDPYNLSGEVQFLHAPAGAGFIACVNLGIAATGAPIVHVLAAGTEAMEGWIETAIRHFDDPRIGTVTPVVYDAESGHLIAAGVEYTVGGRRVLCETFDVSSPTAIGPCGQAAFIRKAAIDCLGGALDTAVGDELADVDLALSLRRAGWQNKIEPECRLTATAARTSPQPGFMTGLHGERLFWRHFGRTNRLHALLAHVFFVLHGFVSARFWKMPAHLAGRVIACCQFGHYRRFQQTMAATTRLAEEYFTANCVGSTAKQVPIEQPTRQQRIDEPHSLRPARSRQATVARQH